MRSSFILLLAGCSGREVSVQVRIPDQHGQPTPLPGVRLVFLPYDRDSLLDALAAQATDPRPDESRLDSLTAAFRGPFNELLRLSALVDAAPDSARRSALQDSLARARESLDRARQRLQPAIDSERARLRAWEDIAFRSYDSVGAALVIASRRDPVVDSTVSDGSARVHLEGGPWWIVARAVNVQDPNAEWYWNVRLDADSVRLGPSNGRSRPRR